jgi:hypothetical protein
MSISIGPVDVDWPALVARAERRGIPVLRVDSHGGMHIIRTTAQLREEWPHEQG